MADTCLDISQHLANLEDFKGDFDVLFDRCHQLYRSTNEVIVEELLAGIIEAQEILACFISIIGRHVQMDDIFQEMYVILDHLMYSLNEYRIHFQDTLEWHQLRYASSTTSKVEVDELGDQE